jgi:outer membrane biosynthesis protein TonB
MNTAYKALVERIGKLMGKAEAGQANPTDFDELKEAIMQLYDRATILSRAGLKPQDLEREVETEVTAEPELEQVPEVEPEAVVEPAPESAEPQHVAETPPPPPVEDQPVQTDPEPEVQQATKPAQASTEEDSRELNERFSSDAPNLSDTLAQSSITDLRTAITLNERLIFAGELFGADTVEFDAAIRKLNDAGTLESAIGYLNELKPKFSWEEGTTYTDFETLVRRRYM